MMQNFWKIPGNITKKAKLNKIEGLELNITNEKASENFSFANITITGKHTKFNCNKLRLPINKQPLDNNNLNSIENYTQIIKNLLNEKYYLQKRPLFTKLPFNYTKIPVPIRLFLNKILLKQKKDTKFPGWPIEKSVELIRHHYIYTLKEKLKRNIPYISFWPYNADFAFSVSHDCDSNSSFKNIGKIRDIERKYNIRSSWNFVPCKYKIDFKKVKALKDEGCEIGLHGFNHSGKLPYLNKNKISNQLKLGLNKLKRYNPKGFRSPLLLRNQKFLKALSNHFEYDSSVPDTDIEHPLNYRNGCCTIFPFFTGKMVELPLTLPQDVRLRRMNLNKQQTLSIWKEKLEFIRKNKGLAMLNIHPDNFASGNEFGLDCYEMLLKHISKINKKWLALPYEVAEWWKERNTSYISKGKIIGSKRAKIEYF